MMKTMNRKYMAWLTSMLLTMVMLPSCESEELQTTFQTSEANTLTLKLLCNDEEGSRSVDNMDNEDKIDRLDVFLYPATASFDTPAAVSRTITVTANESTTVNIPLSNDEVDVLFPNNATTCKIYVIANRPDATTLTAGKNYTVNELKALTVTANFAVFEDGQYQKQVNFVMDSDFTDDSDGNDVVTINRDTHALSGTVPLYRAASKITLEITAVTDVPVTDEDGKQLYQKDESGNEVTDADGNKIPLVWEATTTGMKVRLNDGVKATTIDNTVMSYTIQKTEDQNDYFSFASGNDVKLTESNPSWVHSPAFYSYPMDWSETATTKSEEPYLTLIVPWVRSDKAQSYESTYYQIPISTITEKLVRNTHYHIKLKVSRLGSIVEEKPTVISPSSYIIVPWQTQTVDAYLQDYRYLMVEEKNITIYNEDELYIPYATSHKADIVVSSIEFYQQDITGADPVWEEIKSTEANYYSNLELVETAEGTQIYFKNELDNLYSSPTFDFTPYKVTFTIQHADNENYKETVTITQYPAIYGVAEQNWDYSNNYNSDNGAITNNVTSSRNGNNGFVFVNGYQDDEAYSGTDFFLTANGVGKISGTYSPNRYVFTVSSVEGTNYVIGDPRENSVTYDADDAEWASAPSMTSTTKRKLSNYYGTENSTRTRNMIAPKFRLASAYGALSTGNSGAKNLETLRKRCASYQEDGYPAGRWRLPTEAEFKFIMTQVNRTPATLPPMYLKGYDYWCAHGLGKVGDDGSVTVDYITESNSGNSTRCVYDEWYWKDKLETPAEKNVFTWGDQPR